MTNNTEQQAVPVAQEDREAADKAFDLAFRGDTDGIDDAMAQLFADHRVPLTSKLGQGAAFVAGPIWAEAEDDCFTAEIQTIGGHNVVATVHGATRDEAEQRQQAVLAALATLPCKSGEGGDECSCGDDRMFLKVNGVCSNCGKGQGLAYASALTPDATQTREAEGGLATFGAAMFQRIWDSFTDDGWEIEINDLVTVEAVKAGLVSVTPFDPEVHSDQSGSAEPGDDFYEATPAGRAALNARGGA